MPVEFTRNTEQSREAFALDTPPRSAPPAELPAEPAAPPKQEQKPPRLARPARPATPIQPSSTTLVSGGMYWVFEVLLSLGMLAVAALLWRQDGHYTIVFFETYFKGFAALTWQQWLVPVFFTVAFLGAYPRKELRQTLKHLLAEWQETKNPATAAAYHRLKQSIMRRFVFATIIQLINMGTSFSGLRIEIAGKQIDFFVAFTMPTDGFGLLIPAFIVAGILAFGPELVSRWALPRLWELIQTGWRHIRRGVPDRAKAHI